LWYNKIYVILQHQTINIEIMALAIRPIPTLTGEDARRFVERAEEVAKRHLEALKTSEDNAFMNVTPSGVTREDVRKMWAEAFAEE